MSRSNATITAGLRGSALLAELQEKLEAIWGNHTGAGGPAGDQLRPGQIYVDTTLGAVMQVTQDGLGTRLLWLTDATPHRTHPVVVQNADSPYTADPDEGENVLFVNATAGAVVINLPSVTNPPQRLTVIRIDSTPANAVTVDPGLKDIQGYPSATAITLAKAGDRVTLYGTGSSNPGSSDWLLEEDRSNQQVVVTSTPFTVLPHHELILVDASGGNRVVNLPVVKAGPPSMPPGGKKRVIVKNIADNAGANTVTVTPQAGEQIDGLGAGVGQVLPAVAAGIHPMRQYERDDAGAIWRITGAVL